MKVLINYDVMESTCLLCHKGLYNEWIWNFVKKMTMNKYLRDTRSSGNKKFLEI